MPLSMCFGALRTMTSLMWRGRLTRSRDAETIETELMLADLESLERRADQTRKKATAKDKEAMTILPMMDASLALLQDGKPVRLLLDGIAEEDLKILNGLNLLTSKPVLYVCNVAESDAASGNQYSSAVEQMATGQNAGSVVISAAIEEEIAQLPEEEQPDYLEMNGLEQSASIA